MAPLPTPPPPPGAGFLSPFHIGVVKALQEKGIITDKTKVNQNKQRERSMPCRMHRTDRPTYHPFSLHAAGRRVGRCLGGGLHRVRALPSGPNGCLQSHEQGLSDGRLPGQSPRGAAGELGTFVTCVPLTSPFLFLSPICRHLPSFTYALPFRRKSGCPRMRTSEQMHGTSVCRE